MPCRIRVSVIFWLKMYLSLRGVEIRETNILLMFGSFVAYSGDSECNEACGTPQSVGVRESVNVRGRRGEEA